MHFLINSIIMLLYSQHHYSFSCYLFFCVIILLFYHMFRHQTFPYMLCSMFVYYLNVFCLSFVSETKVIYDVLLYVQLKGRQGISVNFFRTLWNYPQSVANVIHERQSVVNCGSKFAVILIRI